MATASMRRSDTPPPRPGTAAPTAAGSDFSMVEHYLSQVKLRNMGEIFESDRLAEVFSGSTHQGSAPGECPLPWKRYFAAAGLLFSLALNIHTVVEGFVKSASGFYPALARSPLIGNGKAFQDWRLCGQADVTDNTPDVCVRSSDDILATLSFLLHASEFCMIAWLMYMLVQNIQAKLFTDDDAVSLQSFHGWRSVTYAYQFLREAATTSALKVLPQLRILPNKVIKTWKFERADLFDEHGNLNAEGYLHLSKRIVIRVSLTSLLFFCGACALYIKIHHMDVFWIPIGKWTVWDWITFLKFSNQVSGLFPVDKIRSELLKEFIFSGEDSDMSLEEHEAMLQFDDLLHCKLFTVFGRRGYIAALSAASSDTKMLVFAEHHSKTHTE